MRASDRVSVCEETGIKMRTSGALVPICSSQIWQSAGYRHEPDIPPGSQVTKKVVTYLCKL